MSRMEFGPDNPVVRLCLQGIELDEAGRSEEARQRFLRAWNDSAGDLERFHSAYFLSGKQDRVSDRLKWLETALQFALRIDDDSVRSAFRSLYSSIARCHEDLADPHQARAYFERAASSSDAPACHGPFFHGTKAVLANGELLTAGNPSNYREELKMNHVYFTALIHGAGLAAELAKGDGKGRVYIVEPSGPYEHDPNVTDKKFPGNPTRSYRTLAPLRITGEVEDWTRLTPGELERWREKLAAGKGRIIN